MLFPSSGEPSVKRTDLCFLTLGEPASMNPVLDTPSCATPRQLTLSLVVRNKD